MAFLEGACATADQAEGAHNEAGEVSGIWDRANL